MGVEEAQVFRRFSIENFGAGEFVGAKEFDDGDVVFVQLKGDLPTTKMEGRVGRTEPSAQRLLKHASRLRKVSGDEGGIAQRAEYQCRVGMVELWKRQDLPGLLKRCICGARIPPAEALVADVDQGDDHFRQIRDSCAHRARRYNNCAIVQSV